MRQAESSRDTVQRRKTTCPCVCVCVCVSGVVPDGDVSTVCESEAVLPQ